MAWNEASLDLILVPFSILLLFAYHAQLTYRVWKFPTSTVIGVNQINRQVWVRIMMADSIKNGVLAVQTLRNNIMASTLLATAAILLSSVIAVLVSNKSDNNAQNSLILGDRSAISSSIKLLSVLLCFMIAFLCTVQSIRYFSHVSFLISIPLEEVTPGLTAEYVNSAISRGSYFWSIGLRAFYFSLPLFLWIFGPIPMFLCSVVLTVLLHFLDTAKDFRRTLNSSSSSTSHDLKLSNC